MRPIHTKAYNDLLDLFEGNRHTALLDTTKFHFAPQRVREMGANGDRLRLWQLVQAVLNIPVQVSPIVVQSQIVDLISDSSIGISDDYKIQRELLPVPSGYMHFEKPLQMPWTNVQKEKHDISGVHDLASPVTHCSISGVLFAPLEMGTEKYNQDTGDAVWMTRASVDGEMLMVILFSDQGLCEDGCGVVNTPVQTIAWDFGDNFYDAFPKNQELIEDIVNRHDINRRGAEDHLEATGHLIKKLVALFEFMNQKIVASEAIRPELKEKNKRDRKLIKGFNGKVPDLTVVRLRRISAQNRGDGSGDPVQRDIHWAVSGHWRNQPTNDGIKLIWINPYTKGNKALPLRQGSKIFDVGR